MRDWLRSLWEGGLTLASHRLAPWWLGVWSFFEGFIWPFPCETLLLPMSLARPERAFGFAAVATLASVGGGLVGFALGAFLFTLVEPVLSAWGKSDDFARVRHLYREWGAWLVFAGGFTPIPYKLIALSSGLAAQSAWIFIAFSLASRGARFGLEAWLLFLYGERIRNFVERHLPSVALVGFLLVFAFFFFWRHAQ